MELSVEVFLSYNHDNKELAGEIGKLFNKLGLEVFLAHEDMVPSVEWRQEILKHLESCAVLVAIVTNEFLEPTFANQEVRIVIGKGKPPISLRFAEELPGFLDNYQAYPIPQFSKE